MKNLISLGELCNKITDGTHHTPTYTDNGIPFLRVTDITESNNSKKFISETEHLELIKRCNPQKGDILYTKNGTIGVAKKITWDYEFSIFVSLCLLKPNTELVFTDYLVHYLNTKMALSQALSHTKTGTISNLHLIEIKKIKIPVPSLLQQKKIANILDAADALKQNDKAVVAKYDELIQALFLDMFGDPVSNPKGWEKLELGKVIDVRDGTHDSPKYIEKGYPLVTSKNIKNGKLVLDNVNYISQEDYNKINSRSKVDVGDIIMPMIGTIGNPLLVDFEVNFAIKNVALFKFNDKSIITNKMLLTLLNGHFLERFSSLNNKGGTQKFVSLGDIRKMLVPIPPITLQNQFAERVALIEEQKAIAQASLIKSEELFNSLLQKAFKGELA